jgi:phosphoserine aminotransferase
VLVRVFNFAAGPATLPLEVLEQVRGELTDWQGSGMSVMEVSHRSKDFIGVAQEVYNAMPVAGVDALIAFMTEFQRRNG